MAPFNFSRREDLSPTQEDLVTRPLSLESMHLAVQSTYKLTSVFAECIFLSDTSKL